MGRLTAPDVQRCEARLRQRRAALRAALLDRARAGATTAFTPTTVEVHDSKDDAFASLLANLAGTELTHVREELAGIQAALRRIADGSYGACTQCSRDISVERLLVQPAAERCIPCQEHVERGYAPGPLSTSGTAATAASAPPLRGAAPPHR